MEHEDKHFELRPLVVRYSNHRVHFKRAYAVSQIDCKILANFVGFNGSGSDENVRVPAQAWLALIDAIFLKSRHRQRALRLSNR